MGCPFSRGQSLCVHIQRQSAACVAHEFLDRLYVLTAAFQEPCERSAEGMPSQSLGDAYALRSGMLVAQFVGGELTKTAQAIPDWAAKVFGRELHAARQHEKTGRGR